MAAELTGRMCVARAHMCICVVCAYICVFVCGVFVHICVCVLVWCVRVQFFVWCFMHVFVCGACVLALYECVHAVVSPHQCCPQGPPEDSWLLAPTVLTPHPELGGQCRHFLMAG